MIRPLLPADTPWCVSAATGTRVFKPVELQALQEVLDDFHAGQSPQHRAIVYERPGRNLGFAYYAPAAMTDRTWYLWWIVVDQQTQARGIGTTLLHHVEDDVRQSGGRLLLIETSSLPHYDLTRRFYLKHGYARAAILADYYADGDDMVIFRKHFGPDPRPGT